MGIPIYAVSHTVWAVSTQYGRAISTIVIQINILNSRLDLLKIPGGDASRKLTHLLIGVSSIALTAEWRIEFDCASSIAISMAIALCATWVNHFDPLRYFQFRGILLVLGMGLVITPFSYR